MADEDPNAPAGDTPPAPPAEPAPGTNPETPAPGGEAAAGDKPAPSDKGADPGTPPEPGPTPTDDLADALRVAHIDVNDPDKLKKLAQFALQTNNRAAELARAAPQSAKEPAPAEPPDVVDVQAALGEWVQADSECNHLARTCYDIQTDIAKLAEVRGERIIAAPNTRLGEVTEQIRQINTILHPPKVGDVPLVELDEFRMGQAQDRLRDLHNEEVEIRERVRENLSIWKEAYGSYNARAQQKLNELAAHQQEREVEAEEQRQIAQSATAFKAQWEGDFKDEFGRAVTAGQVTEADRAGVMAVVKRAMRVHVEDNGAFTETSRRTFIADAVKAEVNRLDTSYRGRQAEYGRRKVADATPPGAIPASPGQQAKPAASSLGVFEGLRAQLGLHG